MVFQRGLERRRETGLQSSCSRNIFTKWFNLRLFHAGFWALWPGCSLVASVNIGYSCYVVLIIIMLIIIIDVIIVVAIVIVIFTIFYYCYYAYYHYYYMGDDFVRCNLFYSELVL